MWGMALCALSFGMSHNARAKLAYSGENGKHHLTLLSSRGPGDEGWVWRRYKTSLRPVS
jgi:hypothetical protein